MKVFPLKIGHFTANSSIVFRCGNPQESQQFYSYAYYIEEGENKILVDTGFGDPDFCLNSIGVKCFTHNNLSVRDVFQGYGIDPEKINTIILTHCHWDHLGNIEVFPNAQIYCQREEMKWAIIPPVWLSDGYPKVFAEKIFNCRNRTVLLDGDTVFSKSIKAYKVGGHSPGSQIIQIADGNKKVFITGGIVFKYENLSKLIVPGSYFNLEESYAALRWLKNELISDPETIVLPVHDPEVYSRFKEGIDLSK